jgi:phospholipase/carboxylesterase
MMTQSVVILPASKPNREHKEGISHIIALHGLGASVSDLKPVASMMHLSQVHWHFLAAPSRAVTVNAGVLMPAWFDIFGFKETSPVDYAGIKSSCQLLFTHIQALIHQGIAPEHIALLGFSQGGVIALHAGLSAPWRLGAIMGLSTWLPASEQLSVSDAYRDIPIWLGHGSHDDVVPFAAAERAKSSLKNLGMTNVSLTRWQMGHSIHHDEAITVKDWLSSLSSVEANAQKKSHHH